MSDTLNPLESAQRQVKKACENLGADPAVYELLKDAQRVIELSIPVKMDDGSIKVFKGWRSCHNTAKGPSKGGVRFHPDVNIDEVKALSLWMTFKGGVLNLPYGGGKGGICVDPSELSERELEQLSRGYVRGLYKYLGERIDVPAPDVNTNGKIMGWFIDEYIKLNGDKMDMGTFTGKPICLGGSEGRNEATGFGVAVATRELLKSAGLSIENAKVAVQGFGNVGSFTVKNIARQGGKVVALAERDFATKSNFALYNEDGLDFEALQAYKDENKTLKGFPDAKEILAEEFWKGEYDVLVPAALENVITSEVAKDLKVKTIVEGANGPTTPQADEILNERGILVLPDIFANSGGVLVSYYEWVQNQQGYYWSEEEVEEKEEKDLVKAFNGIFKVKEDYKVTFREATYMYAIQSIQEAMKFRGWF
ncbi:MAG: Glu/Leu/Phe/Val dehydrogenase [Finegoldia sp.]|nr:Glu/Leu/Phe/Val dehydrogenase [Finegoldia sp.]